MASMLFYALVHFLFIAHAAAHISVWHPSMFGFCGDGTGEKKGCANTDGPGKPLQDMDFRRWWWHGYLDNPPNNTVLEMPAGGNITLELAGNKAFTSYGQYPNGEWPGGAAKGSKDESVENNAPYWSTGPVGNLHTTGHAGLGGCALSIAYTNVAHDVRPEDFVIFSVNHECVWKRKTVFKIPKQMPPCESGMCMCSWWWIHKSSGGSDQMYQTAFQCNVTYGEGQEIPSTTLGIPVPPVNCEDDPEDCVEGPKMPMYWKQLECNNMYERDQRAPTYNDRYGFADGAQDDIFETSNTSNWTCPQSTAPGVKRPNKSSKSKRSVRSLPLRHLHRKNRLH